MLRAGRRMKITLGYYSDITQRTPAEAIDYAVHAEKEGFDAVWTGDHFHPWVHTGAKCGFAWTWLGALGQRTSRVMMGTGVTAPIIRYHPAIVAQAFATLSDMYPGRPFIAVGTGEAMNELPLGLKWPTFRERTERLEEAVKIMRLLWNNEFVSFRGKYFRLRKANLYTKPKKPIPLYIAANGPTVAQIAGRYADGFLTLPFPDSHYKEVLFPALEQGARQEGRDPSKIEKLMELQMSYDEDYDKAVQSARWWAPTVMPIFFKAPIADPHEIEAHGKLVSDEGLLTGWFISSRLEDHIKNIERYIKLGFTNIHLQSSSPNENEFISAFGKRVLPYLKDTYRE
jgi:coenzyme F420-dependent glucose-6-phosphate dehydrogenase